MSQRRKWLLFGLALVGVLLSIITFSGMMSGPGVTPPQAATHPEPSFSLMGTAFDLLVKLTLVAILIVVTVWLLRRFMTRRNTPGNGLMEVVDRTHLSPHTVLYLVEVGERFVLLGSTSNQLSLLTEITDPASLALLRETKKCPSYGKASLSQSLTAFAARLFKGSASGEGRQAFSQVLTKVEATMRGRRVASKAASRGREQTGQGDL